MQFILFKPVRSFALLLLAVVLVCSNCSSSGCTLVQTQATRYQGPKSDNSANVRVSPAGVSFLNTDWPTLVELFAPGKVLHFGVPCTQTNVTVLGTVTLADQGDVNGNGRMDDTCDSRDLPADVSVSIDHFSVSAIATDTVAAELTVSINTDRIYISKGCIGCFIDFDTNRSHPDQNTVQAKVQLTIDSKWDKLLSFKVTSIDGAKVCGSSGASAAPVCLDPADVSVGSACNGSFTCTVCSAVCSTANWSVIKTAVLNLVTPKLFDVVNSALQKQSCEPCDNSKTPNCPQYAGATSSCVNGLCVDSDTLQCVPRFLGYQGRLALGTLLSPLGAPDNAGLDIFAAAGSSAVVDTGLTLGVRAGARRIETAACVPALTPPMPVAVSVPAFDLEAPTTGPYHVAFGLSELAKA